jgi:hypothetical protein
VVLIVVVISFGIVIIVKIDRMKRQENNLDIESSRFSSDAGRDHGGEQVAIELIDFLKLFSQRRYSITLAMLP